MVALLVVACRGRCERHHAPLDIHVLDNDAVASSSISEGASARNSSSSAAVEALLRKRDVGKLQRVGHAPDAVVVFTSQYFSLTSGA